MVSSSLVRSLCLCTLCASCAAVDAPAQDVLDTSSSSGGEALDASTSDDGSESDGDVSSSTSSSTDIGEHTPIACDPWAQDCPEGEKCMPYEIDPVDMFVWDALGCFPVDAHPKEPGDACTVVESGVSGIDDCALGAMCMGVDDETMMGVCIAMCEGSEAAPRCADPSTTCILANDGVILVCLPQCDPLLQDCADGEGCYESGTGGFFCFAQDDAAAGDAAFGSPCSTLNYCNPGLMCAPASSVPGCTSEYCCTKFCDVAGESACAGADGGQVCTAYFAADAAPPGFTDVGVCAMPR